MPFLPLPHLVVISDEYQHLAAVLHYSLVRARPLEVFPVLFFLSSTPNQPGNVLVG